MLEFFLRFLQVRRSLHSGVILLTLLVVALSPVAAQDDGVQPRLIVHLPQAQEAPANIISLTERINGDLLRRLNRGNRFDLTVRDAPGELKGFMDSVMEEPPEAVDALIAGVVDQRRDGSYRFLFDVWSARLNRVFFSQEFDARGLPAIGNEDAILLLSRQIQEEVEDAVLDLFPGFGLLEFENRGAEADYEVLINDTSFGVNLQEISLLPGSYRIEVLQEIEEQLYTMAEDELQVAVDDYVRLLFELSATPPEIPGYLRVERTADDWRVGMELGYDYLFPVSPDAEEVIDSGQVVLARVVANDIPLRNLILGVDVGLGDLDAIAEESVDAEAEFVPLLGFLGYRFGPLGGWDFTVKAAGGAQLTQAEVEFDPSSISEESYEEETIDPAMRLSTEFGYNWGRYIRLHAGASFWTIWHDEGGTLSFIGVLGGIGIKF
ncbi:MAG: hypothetical protein ACLFQZ_10300 [Spirochaetaceae bacterium]